MPRGKAAAWSKEARILKTALELVSRPVNSGPVGGTSQINAFGYGAAIRVAQKTLDTMNQLQGDELQRFADRYFTSKTELAEALTKLLTLQANAERRFSRASALHL
jgi:hypothetical protein